MKSQQSGGGVPIPNEEDAMATDVIKLQLRKPKHWNWELTTSKSSPNIAFPVIQLLNRDGSLLVEARDNGEIRQRFKSSLTPKGSFKGDINNNTKTTSEEAEGLKKAGGRQLRKCKSDMKSNFGKVLENAVERRTSMTNATEEVAKLLSKQESNKEEKNKKKKEPLLLNLRKSKSDVLNRNASFQNNFRENFAPRPIAEVPEPSSPAATHKRTNSDEMYEYFIKKHKDASMKRAIDDGYRNFIGSNVNTRNNTPSSGDDFPVYRYSYRTSKAGTLLISEEVQPKAVVVSSKKQRYRRRTCDDGQYVMSRNGLLMNDSSAGLQSLLKDSFNKGLSGSNQDGKFLQFQQQQELQLNKKQNRYNKRNLSEPLGCSLKSSNTNIKNLDEDLALEEEVNRYMTSMSSPHRGRSPVSEDTTLGILTPLAKDSFCIRTGSKASTPADCGYTVQEPLTTPTQGSSDGRKSGATVVSADSLSLKRCTEIASKRRRQNASRRRRSRSAQTRSSSRSSRSSSTSSSAAFGDGNTGDGGRRRRCPKRKSNKEKESPKNRPEAQPQPPSSPSSREGDATLLKLVRRLASESNHGRSVNMGANVSRHSSKGLSGRRSQSSGSICNGKGKYSGPCTESEIIGAKLCGSLPSYLDEPIRNGCNNNHHNGACVDEKPPMEPMEPLCQRVPPLGDGAPLHWKFTDNHAALCDQGYGSERSPEDEVPPPLPCHHHQHQHHHHHLDPLACYPFITPESTFTVTLLKGSRGLGLSVTGGTDSTGSWPGLVRVKRLFPHQPAAACGILNVGDLLLEANGITLTGLTNYEALEVLRTTPNTVDLTVCRPPPDVLSCVSPISEIPPPPPRRDPPSSLSLPLQPPFMQDDDLYEGEFDITLTKIQGSLGFTLRKEDDSALGHYVRALVREPALSDGRIRAGDKIIAVNDVEISPMTHEQAVQFLRQCGDEVRLRLYRDAAQTPVAALSPTETTPRTSFRPKAHLRQEAMDMLSDLAVRKLCPNNGDGTWRRSGSPNSSPRRLRRTQCPSDASTDSSSKYMINDHEPLTPKYSNPCDDDVSYNSLFINDADDCDRPNRPCFLDLCSGNNPHGTPVVTRKPKFNFSLAHNAYELNNLDAEILDAPNLTYNMNRDGSGDCPTTDTECSDSFPKEHASMPYMPSEKANFSYKNPVYQSAHPQCVGPAETITNANEVQNDARENSKCVHSSSIASVSSGHAHLDPNSMMKWKGMQLNPEEENAKVPQKPERPRLNSCSDLLDSETQTLMVELNRGWNSRLGFSLQGAAGVTYVSAVHADSVAAKDGRLKPGDRLLKVNDESVENLSTNDIIDLLRIIRGPVCIVISRIRPKQDCIEDRRFDTLDMK